MYVHVYVLNPMTTAGRPARDERTDADAGDAADSVRHAYAKR